MCEKSSHFALENTYLFMRTTHHSGNRGVRRGLLFEAPEDYKRFESILKRCVPEYDVHLYSYCLMPNHDHLQNNCEEENRPKFLRQLHWSYAWGYNQATERTGHVFEERSWSFERWGPFWVPHNAAYIFLNPTLAGLGHHAEYAHSSCAATLGLRPVPDFLRCDVLLGFFSTDHREARKKLARYIDDRLAIVGPLKEARRRWKRDHQRTARARNLEMNVEILAYTAGVLQARLPASFAGLGKHELIQIGLNQCEGASQTLIATAMDMPTSTSYKRWNELQDALKGNPKLQDRVVQLLNDSLKP